MSSAVCWASPERWPSGRRDWPTSRECWLCSSVDVVFGVVYGAYAMFWMAETLPRYYDENRICNFAQGAFHIHIPGIYYNNRNWKHIVRAFRVWSMASLVLVPPCTAGAVLLERATGWQVCGAVLVVYIASLFGSIVIPAKRFE